MKKILFAASALTLLAAAPASAQMMGMMGGSGTSCVSGGQFVPCPGPGAMQPGMMQPGMAMQDGGMEPRRMTRREMRDRRRMMREQQQGM